MKYISCDIETTGLDVKEDQIIEFAAVIDDITDPDKLQSINELPIFHVILKHERYSGSAYAINLNHRIFQILGDSSLPNKNIEIIHYHYLGDMFIRFLEDNKISDDKITMAGKNFASFDLQFLKKPMYNFPVSRTHHRILDPGNMYVRHDDKVIPDTNECLKRAGIAKSVTHEALDDAYDVIKLIRHSLLGKI